MKLAELDKSTDWRARHADTDEDADDELMEQTPQDVVESLGFDPLELEETPQETQAANADLIAGMERESEKGTNRGVAFRAVARTAQLTSVGNWLKSRTDDNLARIEARFVELVQQRNPSANKASLPVLFADAEQVIKGEFHKVTVEMQNHLKTLAKVLAESAADSFAAKFGYRPQPKPSDPVMLPVLGATMAEHLEKIGGDLLFKFRATLRAGLDNGETLEQLVKRVRGEAPVVVNERWSSQFANLTLAEEAAKRLLISLRLTEGAELSINKIIQAAMSAFGSDADYQAGVEGDKGTEKEVGWQWVAVLDVKTCPQCQYYDGSRWTIDYQPIDDATEFPGAPGLHFNCRCSVVPVDLEEAVAPKMDFDDYLSRFSRSAKEQAFGPRAMKDYSAGRITASELVGQQDNLLTLEQFQEAQDDAFDASFKW